jgi:8-oxo-dGTP pyrophosphatase MutT (NUDIX family)
MNYKLDKDLIDPGHLMGRDSPAVHGNLSEALTKKITPAISFDKDVTEGISELLEDDHNRERTRDLAEWTFPNDFSLIKSSAPPALSTGMKAADIPANVSEDEIEENNEPSNITTWHIVLTQEQRESVARRVNVEAGMLVVARQTRVKERQVMDTCTGARIRLVAGCVPILRDGRVVLVGSRKANSWVGLPKGGWEIDETLEEAAIRETFEEAGVLGVLGPCMSSFLVESGKAKSKRLDAKRETSNLRSSVVTPTPEHESPNGVNFCKLNALTPLWDTAPIGDRRTAVSTELDENARTHTCMTFFPLYVQQVKETWPECSRTRTAFPIEGMLQSLICCIVYLYRCLSQCHALNKYGRPSPPSEMQKRFVWFDQNCDGCLSTFNERAFINEWHDLGLKFVDFREEDCN